MELTCIKHKFAHWGSILTQGNVYKVVREYTKDVNVITNYDIYMEKLSITSKSIGWIRKGYTSENLHEVLEGYIPYEEIGRLYTKSISMPHIDITGDDDSNVSLITLSASEIISLGADISTAPNRKKDGMPSFTHTNYLIDEYFDYDSIRRDKKLNNILI